MLFLSLSLRFQVQLLNTESLIFIHLDWRVQPHVNIYTAINMKFSCYLNLFPVRAELLQPGLCHHFLTLWTEFPG